MRVAVIGADLEGLLVAWVLTRHPRVHVDVYDDRDVPPADGLPSLVHTPSVANLLTELSVPFISYRPRIGVLLHGDVQPWPRYLQRVDEATRRRLLHDLDRKGARAALGASKPRAHNGSRVRPQRVRFHGGDIRAALWPSGRVRKGPWTLTADRRVLGTPYDRAVLTVPLWRARGRVPVRVPPVTTTRRTVVEVAPRGVPLAGRWDTLLLPYTPHDRAYRSTSLGRSLAVEFAGRVCWPEIAGELNFLCGDGCEVVDLRGDLPGTPVKSTLPEWPSWITPLGTYAAWKITPLDAVLDRAYELLRVWTKGK